jgi:hypothetical protein
LVPNLPWWYSNSPIIVHVGEEKYSNFKAIKDVIFNGCAKYHCGYGDEKLYKNI